MVLDRPGGFPETQESTMKHTDELVHALRQSTAALLAIMGDAMPGVDPQRIVELEPMASSLDVLERVTGTRELPPITE